ncbi:riboflavin biosynthesis protein RibF [Ileibacterium valens]|nr:riboflavin biosynthesis protein RibF [Ileibacterium valens]
MIVYKIKYNEIPKLKPMSAAIGFFDGFHKGHEQLIAAAISEAKKNHLKSAVITFAPDPWTVFKPDANRDHLLSDEEKEQFCKNLGIDEMIIIEFTREFAALSPGQFNEMLVKLNVKYLVCGFDFTYGYKGLGNPQTLKEQDAFHVEVISSVNDEDGKISSSRIESLIRQGEVSKAASLLGYIYSVNGKVVHGFKRGSSLLGFPTANIETPAGIVLPELGVYTGMAAVDGILYPAMINVGYNPTFDNHSISIEGNLLDFHQDLYGKIVRFFFVSRIRPEIRFNNLDELITQLESDQKAVKPALAKEKALIRATGSLWSLKDSFVIIG